MKLYAWQKDCLNTWINNSCCGIANVTTGAGKTYLAISAMHYLLKSSQGLRIRIIVPTISLVSQWKKSIDSYFNERPEESDRSVTIGVYHGGQKDSVQNDITIYVINSARYTICHHILSDFKQQHPVFLICDECHHYGSTENSHIFDFIKMAGQNSPKYYTLGLSATPFSADNQKILTYGLGEQIYSYDVKKATDDKVISPFAVFEIALHFTKEEWNKYDELSYKISILAKQLKKEYPFLASIPENQFFSAVNSIAAEEDGEGTAGAYVTLTLKRRKITLLADERTSCCIRLLEILPDDIRTIIFCERISQARALYLEIARQLTNKTGIYHSEMSKDARSTTLELFKHGEIHILVACKALDEGMDVPDATLGIVLSSTQTTRQRIQRLGRILRRSGAKSLAALYYLYVKESSDDNAFLAEQDGLSVHRLSWEADTRTFIHPLYDNAALELYQKIADNPSISKEKTREFVRCIEKGQARFDWLLAPEALLQRQKEAQNIREKNYYMVMAKIANLLSAGSDRSHCPPNHCVLTQ